MIKDSGMRTCNCTLSKISTKMCQECVTLAYFPAKGAAELYTMYDPTTVTPVLDYKDIAITNKLEKENVQMHDKKICEESLLDCSGAVVEREISSVLSRLNLKEELLQKTWERIVSRIDPILTPAHPIDGPDECCVETNTTLGTVINRVAVKIDDLIKNMEYILSRIEL